MKKLLLILLLPLVMAGCKTPTYTIGMTEAEFTSHQKMLTTLVEKTAAHAVYKRLTSQDAKGHETYQFFYFENGKLVRIDTGWPG